MLYTISNGILTAKINDKGAELYALKKNGVEHIWQGDPRFWADRAPLLFPVVGRQMEDTLTVNEVNYPIGLHGFAKDGIFGLVSKSENSLELKLVFSEETRKHYPYDFELTSVFCISGSTLSVTRTVKNLSCGKMPFCIGEHFGIMTPLSEKTAYSDYAIELEQPETASRHILNGQHYVGSTEPFLNNEHTIKLSDTLFERDAVAFCGLKSKSASVTNYAGYTVRLSFSDYANLAFWAKPGAPYVCVEPWNGIDSEVGDSTDIFRKDGIILLDENQRRSFTCTITV